ncbi:MAG: glutamate racemase [Oligoflexus sp.]|nr:glutamate racemase [Oligoflexus sp.]
MPLNVDVMVFDSGVGGLSVLEAIRSRLPDLSYCFVGDNAGLPYGDKSESWLVQRVPQVIDCALAEVQCKILVVACNTASTIVLPPLRAKFTFPVIGVVPAIKPAAQLSQKKIIGLLATPATVKRDYTDALIAEFAADCQVIKLGSSRLVTIAEEKMRGIPPDREELKLILAPFAAALPDVVVLGCTHFPLLRQEISEILTDTVWIDSGAAIAQRVAHFAIHPSDLSKSGDGAAFFTASDISLESLKPFGLTNLSFLKI